MFWAKVVADLGRVEGPLRIARTLNNTAAAPTCFKIEWIVDVSFQTRPADTRRCSAIEGRAGCSRLMSSFSSETRVDIGSRKLAVHTFCVPPAGVRIERATVPDGAVIFLENRREQCQKV